MLNLLSTRLTDWMEAIRPFLRCLVNMRLWRCKRETVLMGYVMGWGSLPREGLRAPTAAGYDDFLGHCRFTIFVEIRVGWWSQRWQSVSWAHRTLYTSELRRIFLHETVDFDTRVIRNHVNRLHIFLMLRMQNGKLIHLWLLIHDSLGKLVVFSINPRCLLLLVRIV